MICGRCRGKIGEFRYVHPGSFKRLMDPPAGADHRDSGVTYRCRCGANHPVSQESNNALHHAQREFATRRVVVPDDLAVLRRVAALPRGEQAGHLPPRLMGLRLS